MLHVWLCYVYIWDRYDFNVVYVRWCCVTHLSQLFCDVPCLWDLTVLKNVIFMIVWYNWVSCLNVLFRYCMSLMYDNFERYVDPMMLLEFLENEFWLGENIDLWDFHFGTCSLFLSIMWLGVWLMCLFIDIWYILSVMYRDIDRSIH